ncbi:hypothetical protein DL765_000799 [Monosporascus sp. GIB2]|nr:hypothetical protein DL765_000799 [Monosporascus sp. GIB2]
MASFGRISNSLVTGVNENTLALASLNFDFSLVKFQAPEEYSAVGNALAKSRRENAESGTTHRTARKLGALFDAIIPSVPKVVAAYGKRASHIIETPGVNPSAATSSGSSIAVHLLACLLARAFRDPAQTASVWAELVRERQREIMKTSQNEMLNVSQIAAINAADQPISREELRQWDASARAWLQTADSAMRKEYTQLKLILKNITLPVASGVNLYTDVIRAWKQAMLGLEHLLNGEPQSVTDGAILLAISSWHLYPNLLVLGNQTTTVDFADHLVPSAGVLTVGITNSRASAPDRDGIYWSVALSHYRYYGRPTKAIGEIDDRLTIEDLHMVALGSLLGSWKVSRAELEISAIWFVALWQCINRVKASIRRPKWLEIIANGAKRFLEATDAHKRECLCLLDFGQRRGRNFLSKPHQQAACLPWFGLRSRHILETLSFRTPKECAVQYLRQLASTMNLKYDEALITKISNETGAEANKGQIHEYMTAVHPPRPAPEKIVSYTGLSVEENPGLEEDSLPSPRERKLRSWDDSKAKMPAHTPQAVQVDISTQHDDDPRLYWHQTWEGSFNFSGDGRIPAGPSQELSPIAVALGAERRDKVRLPRPLRCDRVSNGGESALHDCQAYLPDHLDWFRSSPVHFTKVLGDSQGTFRLWITGPGSSDVTKLEKNIRDLRTGKNETLVDIETVISMFESGQFEPLLIWQYLEGAEPYEPDSFIKPLLELMCVERQQCEVTINCLRSLALAQTIYNQLDGATISCGIVERGIHDAKWRVTGRQVVITRSIVFSCIAMLETGRVNLDAEKLDQVIALSSGNSLFISTRLLSDPTTVYSDFAVTRIVGNIGRPGISLLIPPAACPLVRALSSSFRAVSYAPFDGNREDNFKSTSLHLSFTSHEFPVDYGDSGIIDHQVFLVESVISVYDAGEWVADLDVLKIFNKEYEQRFPIPRSRVKKACIHSEESYKEILEKFAVIDSWEEVLDTPPAVGLVRAHKNWPARLAISVILSQPCDAEVERDDSGRAMKTSAQSGIRRLMVLENGDDVCWVCVYRRLSKRISIESGSPAYLIT